MSVRFTGVAIALLVLLVSAQSALAGTLAGATWGWVTARQPATAMYTPAAKDQGNYASQSNSVEKLGTGDYRVTYADLDNGTETAGIPIVTAMSTSPRFCGVLDWGINNTTLDANTLVRCFSADGEAINSQFSAIYVRGGSDSGLSAYVLANQPVVTNYTPDPSYSFNSTGMDNTMHRSGTGRYQAHLPNMTNTGNIQLTPDGDFRCKVSGRTEGTNELIVDVNCFDPAGNPQDGSFLLLYTNGVGPTTVTRPKAAYLFANKPSTSSYTPDAALRYSSVGMGATISRSGVGKYLATLSGMPKGGAAFVTAVGSDKAFCQLTSIRTSGTPQKVGVACFKPNGAAVDAKFMLAYTK